VRELAAAASPVQQGPASGWQHCVTGIKTSFTVAVLLPPALLNLYFLLVVVEWMASQQLLLYYQVLEASMPIAN
jgi:hypothetical protein